MGNPLLGLEGGKRHQRTLTFDGLQYPTEADVRKALELTVSQVNAGAVAAKADAKFSAITALYRSEHLPTLEHSSRLSRMRIRDFHSGWTRVICL